MRVLLVWPAGANDGMTLPLFALYLLPALRRAGHHAELFDCAIGEHRATSDAFQRRLLAYQPDVVGVSAWTVHRDEATAVLREAKRIVPGVTTVAGGPHFSGCAEYAVVADRDAIDYVIRGEAEESLPRLITAIQVDVPRHPIPGVCFVRPDGTPHLGAPHMPEQLDALGPLDYDEIGLWEYLRRGYRYRSESPRQAAILATRGCPYTCDFCAAPTLNGRRIRKHSVAYLMALVGRLYDAGIRHVNVIDDNFTFDVGFAKEFCRAVVARRWRGLRFGTPNGIRVERTDEQLFWLMRAAGWRDLIVAPESGSQRMVDAMQKHLDLRVVPPKVRQIQGAGLEVEAFFIVGHPGETIETVEETRRFIALARFDSVAIHIFQPLHGTPIHEQLLSHGLLTQETRIASYGAVNWVPPGWTRDGIIAAVESLRRSSVAVRRWRVEHLVSRFAPSGRVVRMVVGDRVRRRCFAVARRARRAMRSAWFRLVSRRELARRVVEPTVAFSLARERDVRRASDALISKADLALRSCASVASPYKEGGE